MTVIRRSAGFGTMLLSILGLLLCVAAIAGIWAMISRIDAVEEAVFATADESLVFMETKLEQVTQAIEHGRERTDYIAKAAQRVRETGAQLSDDFEPLRQRIDELFAELRAAEHWLDSSQAIAAGVARVSQSVASSEAAASREVVAVTAAKVREFSLAVSEVIAKLQVVRQEIIEMRENRVLAREIAARVVNRLIEMNGTLETSAARIKELRERTASLRVSCDDLAKRVNRWTLAAAAALTAVLGWFAISQFGMMGYARRMMRSEA